MTAKIISCSFVVLYEHATAPKLEATLDSAADFVRSYPKQYPNPFDLLVIVGDSKRGDVPRIPRSAGFDNVSVLDRSHWILPGEQDFGPWPVVFNLANIALKRVPRLSVMMLACGSRITDKEIATAALAQTYKDEGLALLSASPSQNRRTLIPNGIIFKYAPGWKNLATAMNGTLVDVKKGLLGNLKIRVRGKAEPTAFSDADVIAAIAYDYQRNRYGYGERVVLSEWAS